MHRILGGCLGVLLAAFLVTGSAEAAKGCLRDKGGLSYKLEKTLERCNRAVGRAQRRERREALAVALIHRGMVHVDAQDYDAALADAQAALTAAETLPAGSKLRPLLSALILKGFIYDRRGDTKALSATIDRIVNTDLSKRDFRPVLASLILAAQRRGLLEDTARLLTVSLSLEGPDYLKDKILTSRAMLYWKLENLPAAEADLTALIEMNDTASLRLIRAKIYRKQGRHEAALADLGAALQDDDFDPGIIKIAASLYNQRVHNTPAEDLSEPPRPITRKDYRDAAAYAQILVDRCEVLLELERVEEAAAECGRAEALFPNEPSMLKVLQKVAKARNRPDEAAKLAERIAALEAKQKATAGPGKEKTPADDREKIDEMVARKILSPAAAAERKQYVRMSMEMRTVYTTLHGDLGDGK